MPIIIRLLGHGNMTATATFYASATTHMIGAFGEPRGRGDSPSLRTRTKVGLKAPARTARGADPGRRRSKAQAAVTGQSAGTSDRSPDHNV